MHDYICIKCGSVFKTNKKNKKYCSRQCRYLYRNKISYDKNKERILTRLKTKESRLKQNQYNKKPERQKWHRDYLKEKRKSDPIWKLKLSIVDRIRKDKRLNKQSRKNIEQYLNQPLKDILKHLTSIYTISDFLDQSKQLEVDHIILYNSYHMDKLGDQEFRKCWDKRNLRLIPKEENRNRNQDQIDWKLVKEFNISDLLPEDPLSIFNRIKNLLE